MITRETWFRILQVAVVAPWLYQNSSKAKGVYFQVGLKLVAGSIIALNTQPLIAAALEAQAALQKIQAQANGETVTSAKLQVIEGGRQMI